MSHLTPARWSILLLACLLFTGCATQNGGVTSLRDPCCTTTRAEFRTFGLVIEEAPEFLRPYLNDAFTQVMQEKGLERQDENPDLLATLSFERTELREERQKDDFEEHLGQQDSDFRFLAAVRVELKDRKLNQVIWAGTVSREHDVFVGEYMHQTRARTGIARAFARLFEEFPIRAAAATPSP